MFGGFGDIISPTLTSTLSNHLDPPDSTQPEFQGFSLAVDSNFADLVQVGEPNTMFGIDPHEYSVLLGLMFPAVDPGHSQLPESTPPEPLTAPATSSQVSYRCKDQQASLSSRESSPCSAPEHQDNAPPDASNYFLPLGGEMAKCIWRESSGSTCDLVSTREQICKHVKRVHLKLRPHVCPICKWRFFEKSERDNHVNVHTGNKPFKCKWCSESFASSGARWYHKRSHR